MATPAITVDRVSKRFRLYHEKNQFLKTALLKGRRGRYEEFWALRDVSFEVAQGEAFGIIGPNGSGKSTLLKCLAQILTPDEGRLVHSGSVSALLELGAGFHPELSGRENIYLNGAILGLSRKELDRKFDEIVDFAGLERFIDSPIKSFSSGMYVRLGFAVAVNVDPDILVIDEVLAVGDENFQRKCAEKISDFRHEGRTIVLVSHGLDQVRNLCERVAWLNGGRLEAIGDPAEVIRAYAGTTHEDSQPTATGVRWGSGEVTIHEVELLDERQRPIRHCRTGDTVTLRLHFRANEPIEHPVFGVAIHTIEGVHVTGPNTRDVGLDVERIEGQGHVDLTLPSLPLLQGTYDLTTAIHDHEIAHCYDLRQPSLRFDVLRGAPAEEHGFVSLSPRWSVSVDGAVAEPVTTSRGDRRD